MLAAPAQRFVCCTEAAADGKAPEETDGKKAEPTDSEPLQTGVAQESGPTENGSNQPQTGGVGVTVQAKNSDVAREVSPCPPQPGK